MYCPHCGAKIDDNARFCPECGKSLSGELQTTQRELAPLRQPSPSQPRVPEYTPEPTSTRRKNTSFKKPQFQKEGSRQGSKLFFKILAVAIVGLVAYLGYDYFANGVGGGEEVVKKTTKPYFHLNEEEESRSLDLSKITGNKYNLTIPNGVSSKSDQFVTEEISGNALNAIKAEGVNPFGTALQVSLKGKTDDSPVYLEEYATVSFDIPKEMTISDYDRILGFVYNADAEFPHSKMVIMTPDSKEFANGKIVFHTSHFSCLGLTYMDDDLVVDRWLDQASVLGWENAEYTANAKSKLREAVTEGLRYCGLGKNDLGGKLLKEALSDNTYLAAAVDVLHGDDAEEKALEMIKHGIATKYVGKVFERLQLNPDDKEAMAVLKEHITPDNANSIAEALANGEDVYDQVVEVVKKVEETIATNLSAPVKIAIKGTKMAKIAVDYWADSSLEEKYQEYKKVCNQEDGTMRRDDWNIFTTGGAMDAIFRYFKTEQNVSEEQHRERFRKRFLNEQKIAEQRKLLENRLKLWHELGLLDRSKFYLKFNYDIDMSFRLLQLSRLTQRFSEEFMVNGRIPNSEVLGTEYVLADIVHQYLSDYPDMEAFYKWIDENGYRVPPYRRKANATKKTAKNSGSTDSSTSNTKNSFQIPSKYSASSVSGSLEEYGHTMNFSISGGYINPKEIVDDGPNDKIRRYDAYIKVGQTISVKAVNTQGYEDTGMEKWNYASCSVSVDGKGDVVSDSKSTGANLPSASGSYVVQKGDKKISASVNTGTEKWHPMGGTGVGIHVTVNYTVVE